MSESRTIPIPPAPERSFISQLFYYSGLTLIGVLCGLVATIIFITALDLVVQFVLGILGLIGSIISFLFL